MKLKTIIHLLLVIPVITINAQTGINTQNPQSPFHVDGKGNNPLNDSPSATEAADDFIIHTNGQVSVGTIDTDPSAMVNLVSSDKGFLPPRIALSGRTMDLDGIAGQAEGIIVYNTNENTADGKGLHEWRNGRWVKVGIPDSESDANGTAIKVDGQTVLAQEISLLMSNDYVIEGYQTPLPIKNLDIKIIDNYNTYNGDANGNSFTVAKTGIYQIIFNAQIGLHQPGQGEGARGNNDMPYIIAAIGIWNNDQNNWVVRTHLRNFNAINSSTLPFTTYTQLEKGTTYSFRMERDGTREEAKNGEIRLVYYNSGETGRGPVTSISLKRVQ